MHTALAAEIVANLIVDRVTPFNLHRHFGLPASGSFLMCRNTKSPHVTASTTREASYLASITNSRSPRCICASERLRLGVWRSFQPVGDR